MSRFDKQAFQDRLNGELASVRLSSREKNALLQVVKGEEKVKKKRTMGALLAAALILVLCGAALAATGAFEALTGLWQDSFARMNTTGVLEVVDEPELPAFVEDFQEEYQSQYGTPKADLVVSTVPGAEDLPLEEAMAIARRTVQETFGTPESELDAMGVYPQFCVTPEMDEPSEWVFYFTPLTGADIDEDHFCPAPGEYRVMIQSPSGEVTGCFWYNDDFWPTYARRAWDAGKTEYVYAQAAMPAFRAMSGADQAAFLTLFEEAGLDISGLEGGAEARLRDMQSRLDNCEDNMLESPSTRMAAATAEIERRWGLTRQDLKEFDFAAMYGPFTESSQEIFFGYSSTVAAGSGIGSCENVGVSYAARLGLFSVTVNPQTGEALSAVHIDSVPEEKTAEKDGALLSRSCWTCADLPQLREMLTALRELDVDYEAGLATKAETENRRDKVLLSYGGDPALYTADHAEEPGSEPVMTVRGWLRAHGLTEEAVTKKGLEVIAAKGDASPEELTKAETACGTHYDDDSHPDTNLQHPTLLVFVDREDGTRFTFFLAFDRELNVTEYQVMTGPVGSNG